MKILRFILLACTLCAGAGVAAQPVATERFDRPLGEVLDEVAARFGVQIRCKRFAADTVTARCADFRLRPYSLDESLDNLLRPLDLVWARDAKHEGRIVVQPYEYYRHTPDDGRKLLAWLSAQYADLSLIHI